MILSDFLSRQKQDDSNPHEIMPIFNMQIYYRVEIITEVKENKGNIKFRQDHKPNLVV